MTVDKIKKYLNQPYKINVLINKKIDEKNTIRCLLEKTTPTLSSEPKGNNSDDKMERYVWRLVELDTEINSLIDRLVLMRRKVNIIIMSIDGEHQRKLLKMRYLDYKPWGAIAETLHKHTVYVKGAMHKSVLIKIHNILC
jgi:hypothetical protein